MRGLGALCVLGGRVAGRVVDAADMSEEVADTLPFRNLRGTQAAIVGERFMTQVLAAA